MPEPGRIVGDGTSYVGKRLLVGLTYVDVNEEVIGQEQFQGRIIEAREGEVIVERADTGERVSLPPILQEAKPGEYRLRSTGEVVIDPDYLATLRWKKNVGRKYEPAA